MSIPSAESLMLKEDYDNLVLTYQDKIHRVVTYFGRSYQTDPDTRQDIIQDINVFLLEKKDYLQNRITKDRDPSGFLYVIIRHECTRLIKKYDARKVVPDLIHFSHSQRTPEEELVIRDEITRLDKILGMFSLERAILELCLKISYKIPLNQEDIKECFHSLAAKEMASASVICKTAHTSTDSKVHELLCPFFNTVEGKNLNAGSRIRRISNRKKEIMTLLEQGGIGKYDDQALQHLFELYNNSREHSNSRD